MIHIPVLISHFSMNRDKIHILLQQMNVAKILDGLENLILIFRKHFSMSSCTHSLTGERAMYKTSSLDCL